MTNGKPGDTIETLYVDIAARADQLVADAEVAVQQVIRAMGQVDRATEQTESLYKRLGRTIKQALTIATGIQFANITTQLINKVVGFGKALISTNAQMQMFERSFEVLTGSAEEAGEIIEWVKEQAKATPFDVPGLIAASQQLMTWGLDLKEWFTVVGDVAAGMNRPLSQVVNAVGTLATGQTGEAIRRFRDLGINLREFTDLLEFDARGALVTPLEEAIPIVKQIMVDKFGGMMESQSKTWAGVMSNLGDTWQQFVQVVGEPVFETLNESLFQLYEWVEQNEDAIESFARNLGTLLGGALDILMDLLGAVGNFLLKIDEAISKLAGTTDWMGEGIAAARQAAAILTAPITIPVAGFKALGGGIGAALGGESWEAISGEFEKAGEYAADYMNAIAGVREEVDELGDSAEETTTDLENLTKAQEAGLEAVKKINEAYSELSDKTAATVVESMEGVTESQLKAARAFLEDEDAISKLPPWVQAVIADNRDLVDSTLEVAEAYETASREYIENEAALAALHAQQQEALQLAQEVGTKLGERMRSVMEDYEQAITELSQKAAEEIAEIEAEAAAAEAAAIEKSQKAIAQAREDFSREQMQRRRQFNIEWARLIREQNQAVIDAEWEYEFQKQNLLIEGDEIALAELEARYEHEKGVRARDQSDARDDLRQRFDEENQRREEQFRLQIKALEDRLQTEIENIREKAAEEVQAKKEALEERLAHEDEALRERLEKLGELLAEEVEGNQLAANLVLDAWRASYGGQVAEAVQAGMIIREELNAITLAAINTAAAMRGIRLPAGASTGRTPVLAGGRQFGGYSPPEPAPVMMHPEEFTLTAGTTAALEEIAGGKLTQQTVLQMAESRRVVDMSLTGYGVPADVIERIEQELIDAFTREGKEF